MAPQTHSGCSPVAVTHEEWVNIEIKSKQWKAVTVKQAKSYCRTQLGTGHAVQSARPNALIQHKTHQINNSNQVKQMSNVFIDTTHPT